MPCARRLTERGIKAAPSKPPTLVNSVAFLYVAKCGANNHALPSGIVKMCSA